MNVKYILLFFLLLTGTVVHAQKGYYITSEKKVIGVNLKEGNDRENCSSCRIEKKDGSLEYLWPEQVLEYGLATGRVFISRTIPVGPVDKRVFLERLYVGERTLYYYKEPGYETYFLEDGTGNLVEIPMGYFRRGHWTYCYQLQELTSDTPGYAKEAFGTDYRKKTMIRFFIDYEKFKKGNIILSRKGILAGPVVSYLRVDDYYRNFSLKPVSRQLRGGLVIGVASDRPVRLSGFSFNPELVLSAASYSAKLTNPSEYCNLSVKTVSLSFPLPYKYHWLWGNNQFYVKSGFSGRINIVNAYREVQYTRNLDTYQLTRYSESRLMPNLQLGWIMGCGMEQKLNNDCILAYEFRYTRYFIGSYDLAPESWGVSIYYYFR